MLAITGINGVLGVVVTGLFITFILDRIGRKPPLMFGAIGLAICLAIEAAITAKWGAENARNPAAQKAGIAFIIVRLPSFREVMPADEHGSDFPIRLLQR